MKFHRNYQDAQIYKFFLIYTKETILGTCMRKYEMEIVQNFKNKQSVFCPDVFI